MQGGAQQGGPYMGIPVTIPPPLVVFIIDILGCEPFNGLAKVIDYPTFIFNGGKGCCGTWYKKRNSSLLDAGICNLALDKTRNIKDISTGGRSKRYGSVYDIHQLVKNPPLIKV